jgi:D-alanine-D-alanine ligase
MGATAVQEEPVMVPEGRRQRTRVGVIFGGRSGEHEVSLMSAQSVLRAIDQEQHEIVPIGISKEGGWMTGADPMGALLQGSGSEPAALLGDPGRHALMKIECGDDDELRLSRVTELDVIIPILHGPYGEDGSIQGLFELAGVPYVGAGVLGSAVAMDKVVFKKVMEAEQIPVLPYRLVLRSEWERDPAGIIAEMEASFSYPVFTKPANLGSSVGIRKCHQGDELEQGLREAARYDRRLLVEQGIEAREIECSVLGNDEPIASVAGEIVPSREFYSYQAKYLDMGEEASELVIPAPIAATTLDRVRRWAVRAYKAIDCAGMARVDFLLEKGTDRLYLNEINTIPGFTAISMYPKLWEASGLSYSELIERLIELAWERHADKQRNQMSYGN